MRNLSPPHYGGSVKMRPSQSRARATPIHDTKYRRRRREESLFSCLSRNNKTPHVVSYSFMNWPWGPPLVPASEAVASCSRGHGEMHLAVALGPAPGYKGDNETPFRRSTGPVGGQY